MAGYGRSRRLIHDHRKPEDGDFSDLPDELRPEGYTADDDSDPDDPSDEFDGDE